MKKTNLENWICETEALPELTREGLATLAAEAIEPNAKSLGAAE